MRASSSVNVYTDKPIDIFVLINIKEVLKSVGIEVILCLTLLSHDFTKRILFQIKNFREVERRVDLDVVKSLE